MNDRQCPDCGVEPGALHRLNCDVERCPTCGGQLLSCGHRPRTRFIRWTGEWPGKSECREFGWYAKLLPGRGWVRSTADDPDAHEDLNRLYTDAVWDKRQQRFILAD